MFRFLDTQLETLKNETSSLDEKMKAQQRMEHKLTKIQNKLSTAELTEIDIDETNIDEVITGMTKFLDQLDLDNMKTSEFDKLLEIKSYVASCQKFLAKDKITQIFVHDKDNHMHDITDKIRANVFIEQSKN